MNGAQCRGIFIITTLGGGDGKESLFPSAGGLVFPFFCKIAKGIICSLPPLAIPIFYRMGKGIIFSQRWRYLEKNPLPAALVVYHKKSLFFSARLSMLIIFIVYIGLWATAKQICMKLGMFQSCEGADAHHNVIILPRFRDNCQKI